MNLSDYFTELPMIAILRGIQNHECVEIGHTLVEAGFRCIEVPMNSPNAIDSIALLVKHLPSHILIGAGTVMNQKQIEQIHQVGGRLIVMPHADVAVIRAAKEIGMICTPGAATLTEAFAALEHGADALKLFPAESVPPSVLKAWRSVLPAQTLCLPVGGVRPDGMSAYLHAGANGFGLGSNLYQAGHTAAQVKINADAYANAWHQERR
jgi:2-dehydro-3-deoxyphosphogalactonate aldolase